MSITPPPPPLPPALIQARHEFDTSQSILLSFTAILFWDCLASFPLEYRTMWKKKQTWSVMRVLFFLNRYSAVLALIFGCVFTLGTIPADVCRRSYWTLLLTGDIVFVICDAILIVRVIVVYDRSRLILGILLTLWFAEIGVLVWAGLEPQPLIVPLELAETVGFHGCAASVPAERAVKAAFLGWAPSLIMNIIVLSMTLWKSISIRIRIGTLPLLQQIQNDGIIYFFVVVSINIISLGFAAQSRPALQASALPALIAIMSIACNRLILSLRSRESTRTEIELSDLSSSSRRRGTVQS